LQALPFEGRGKKYATPRGRADARPVRPYAAVRSSAIALAEKLSSAPSMSAAVSS